MMSYLKYIFFTITFIFYFFQNSCAQSSARNYIPNHMFWGSTVINGKIKNKFNYQCDFEYRRQADPNKAAEPGASIGTNHFNIFKHPYQYAIRPWIHYQMNSNVRLSWSPITWFGTFASPVNGVTIFQPELRTSPQVTFTQEIGRVVFSHRLRYEFRFYGVKDTVTNTGNPIGSGYNFPEQNRHNRFRYLLRAVIPLNTVKVEKGTWYILTSSELFIKMGKYVRSDQFVDQNRAILAIGYKFHKDMRIEAGYMNQTAFRFNNKAKNNIDVNHNLVCTLIFDDLNSFFKSNKKEKNE